MKIILERFHQRFNEYNLP